VLDVAEGERMDLPREDVERLHQFVLVLDAHVLLDQRDVRGQVLDADPEELPRVVGIGGVERMIAVGSIGPSMPIRCTTT
jgi:hypothetical protein